MASLRLMESNKYVIPIRSYTISNHWRYSHSPIFPTESGRWYRFSFDQLRTNRQPLRLSKCALMRTTNDFHVNTLQRNCTMKMYIDISTSIHHAPSSHRRPLNHSSPSNASNDMRIIINYWLFILRKRAAQRSFGHSDWSYRINFVSCISTMTRCDRGRERNVGWKSIANLTSFPVKATKQIFEWQISQNRNQLKRVTQKWWFR